MPKLCECGCGEPAPIARITNRKWGHVKGQPMRFVLGHSTKGHMLLHRRQRAYLACGNPRAERCQICRAYDRQESIVIRHSNAGRHRSYHIECERAAYRRQRLARQARNREAAQQSAD
jgi:hypothetical protein